MPDFPDACQIQGSIDHHLWQLGDEHDLRILHSGP
eukprot:COSAG02_NODE_13400_length_1399_cov_2.540769_2_plen_34_part_01